MLIVSTIVDPFVLIVWNLRCFWCKWRNAMSLNAFFGTPHPMSLTMYHTSLLTTIVPKGHSDTTLFRHSSHAFPIFRGVHVEERTEGGVEASYVFALHVTHFHIIEKTNDLEPVVQQATSITSSLRVKQETISCLTSIHLIKIQLNILIYTFLLSHFVPCY